MSLLHLLAGIGEVFVGSAERPSPPRPVRGCLIIGYEGAKAIKQGPGRFETAKSLAEGLGGRIVAAYVTTGQYDVVHILDMPNGDAMTKYSIAASSGGAARTTTVRAYTTEEWAKLLAEAP